MISARTKRSVRASPPHDDQIEVSIFGPGKGEAVAIHLGGGDWITVDSCVNQRSRRNALLDYFELIDVDPAKAVHVVVGTHAHDDHIAGIGELYERSTSAIFVCSQAITSEEFLRTVEIDERVASGVRPSVREQYRRVFDEADRRKKPGVRPIRRAMEDRIVWSRTGAGPHPAAEVRCLSPSDQAVTRAIDDLARHAISPVGGRKRFTSRDPNEFAVALWVTFGSSRILLGADLPIGPAGCGWMGIMANLSVGDKASLFKVPHHGSITAHHEPVWDDLLEPEPVALLAPYRGGRKPLPGDDDIRRIKDRTSRGYLTASPRPIAKRASVRHVGSALDQLASNVRDPWGAIGQARARRRPNDTDWVIEAFDPAFALS